MLPCAVMGQGRPVEVRLSDDQIRMAACCAGLRFVPGLRDQRALPDGRPGGERDTAMLAAAACAEMALALWLNVFWDGANNCGKADLKLTDGTPVEVRYSAYSSARLHVYPHEADGSVFVLVTGGSAGRYILRGWLLGSEAKLHPLRSQKEGRTAAHWVDPKDLRDIVELAEMSVVGEFLF